MHFTVPRPTVLIVNYPSNPTAETVGIEFYERLVAWERSSAEWVTGGSAVVMTPLPGTVYGPTTWDDASLEDWLPPPDEG